VRGFFGTGRTRIRGLSAQRAGAKVVLRKSNRGTGVGLAEAKIASKNARLTITNSCFAGLEIAIKKRKTILGKNLACDICLDDSLVSDEHAAILRTDAGFLLEDLNSRNGLTLNGREVHQKKLRNGDMIEIGTFRLKFSYAR
jgi:hypothetical protein